MRVLQVHNRQLAPGGADVVIENDARMLRDRGHEVDQLILSSDQELDASSRLRAGAKAVWNISFARELDATLAASRPDVMHVHTPFPLMSPVVFRVGARRGVPTVATVHSYRYSCITGLLYRDGRVCEDCVGKRFKLAGVAHRCYHESLLGSCALTAGLALHRSLGTFSRGVDVWLAHSRFMAAKLVAEGVAPSSVMVNPNTVPDPGMRGEGAGTHALFLGRLEPEKGVATLLAAWESMEAAPLLTIAGDGSMRGAVEEAAGRNSSIRYAGWVEREEAAELLATARFLVIPSEWYESGPLSPIESLAVGTPMVASDVGNFSEMIEPGVNGFLFRSGDAAALAAVAREAWSAEDRMPAMRAAARRRYEAVHAEGANATRLLDAYDRALGCHDAVRGAV
jgi:glycosyltransferase involved in cell wall biosynthesis